MPFVEVATLSGTFLDEALLSYFGLGYLVPISPFSFFCDGIGCLLLSFKVIAPKCFFFFSSKQRNPYHCTFDTLIFLLYPTRPVCLHLYICLFFTSSRFIVVTIRSMFFQPTRHCSVPHLVSTSEPSISPIISALP